jgi:ribose transport system substrate-binding protein
MKVSNRVSAEFTVESGQQVTANLLQAAPKLDAVWNHDDDQGVGVLAAIDQAGRTEFIMVGGAGSKNAMQLIKDDSSVLKCTVTYPPSMASDAINLARLVGQEKGMGDLVEKEIPASITLASATVTKENVDKYLPLGFAS